MAKKFKQTLVLLICSIGAFSFAESSKLKNLTCATNFPTTSFVVERDKDDVKVTVINHNGVEHAPIYKGLTTPYTLAFINKAKENLEKMGDRLTASFKISDCSEFTENHLTCFNKKITKIGNLEVKDLYVNIYKNITSNPYGTFHETYASFEYRNLKNRGFRIPMDYEESDCSASF
jgi:hypothetical protein